MSTGVPCFHLMAALILLAHPASGWWDTGHMLTAAIARSRLSPAAAQAADALVDGSLSVQQFSPVPSSTLISAAHWPDDIKRRDWPASQKVQLSPSGLYVAFDASQLNEMHYIDLPFGWFCFGCQIPKRCTMSA